jgi:hypothetical protein
MTAAEKDGAGAPLTSDQVLDEVGFLATVCHSVLVEALTIAGAAGRDLPPDQFGPVNDQAAALGQTAGSIAQSEMFRFRRLNDALAAAGRGAETGRAASIASDSVPEISLAPLTPEQFIDIVPREQAIGQAIAERYARLAPSVTTAPVFSGTVLSGDGLHVLQGVIQDGQDYPGLLASYGVALGGVPSGKVVRATRRDADDDSEQNLLGVSDLAYRVLIDLLGVAFAPSSGLGFGVPLQTLVGQMNVLDGVNTELTRRGLLPPFSPLS